MKDIITDTKLISYCGLYCGSCRKYLNGKCASCADNVKASWCKVRTCNIEKKQASCADCKEFPDSSKCKIFNNIFAKFFSLVFRSDRDACLTFIRTNGYSDFAAYMSKNGWVTIKRK